MKKPHKTKPRKTAAKPARAHGAQPAALQAHSTRRQPAIARPDPRRQHTARHLEPATIYRRPNPLMIESRDDRQAFRLLLLPFVIMALVIAIVPSLHVFPTLRDLIAETPLTAARAVTQAAELRLTPPPSIVTAYTEAPAPAAQPKTLVLAQPELSLPIATPAAGEVVATPPLPASTVLTARPQPPAFDTQRAAAPALLAWAAPPALVQEHVVRRHTLAPAQPAFAAVDLITPAPLRPIDVAPPAIASAHETVALLAPPRTPRLLLPLPPTPYETSCPVSYGSATLAAEPEDETGNSAPFGERLAVAAVTQLKHFVIYDDRYRQISRTGGDVPALYGVCTDVVIRAYRAVGIDLQMLVQASRLGAGDPNIDHRRTETLRRFFARYGRTLPITPFGEDYQPGDIVTYWRPQNSGSRSHIAVVSAERGPSGRPMIIHNRGWGPQIEDGLFVDRLTGHYRYDGVNRPVTPQLAANRAQPFSMNPATLPIALPAQSSETPQKPNGL